MKLLKKRLLDWPLAKKLHNAIAFLVVLPMFLLLLTVSVQSYRALEQQTMDNTVNSVVTFSSNAQTIFEVGQGVGKYITASNQIQECLRVFRNDVEPAVRLNYSNFMTSYLDQIIDMHGLINSIIIISKNGDVFCSRNVDADKVAAEQYLDESKYTGTADWFVEPNVFSNNLAVGESFITRIQTVSDISTGAQIGYVLINIPEQMFFERFSQMQYGESSFIGIVDQNGQIISASNKRFMETGLDDQAVSFLQSQQTKQYTGKLSVKQAIDIKDWYIYAEIPIRDIFFENTQLIITFFAAGILFLVVMSILSLLVLRQISRPLYDLVSQMNQVGNGDLSIQVQVGGKDEIGMLAATFNCMTVRLKRLMDDIVEKQSRNRELEFVVLQSQIKPHFLYNTLESICALILTDRQEDAYDVAKDLGLFYRSMMMKSDNVISIRKELDICRYYLEIQQIRYQEKLRFRFDVPDCMMEEQIVKLTLQPLVENAIYHGLKEKENGGEIVISGRIEQDHIVITVADDGVGMDVSQLSRGGKHHFGVFSVDERIKLNFGTEYGVTVHSQIGCGTTVVITLPYGGMSSAAK